VQLRRDWLFPVGLYHTEARDRLSTTREDRVGQTMASVYGQTEVEWARALRTTFGVRADTYQFSVTSNNRLNSGDGVDAMVSPKLGRRVRTMVRKRSSTRTQAWAFIATTHAVL
jgi:hypothetical protein